MNILKSRTLAAMGLGVALLASACGAGVEAQPGSDQVPTSTAEVGGDQVTVASEPVVEQVTVASDPVVEQDTSASPARQSSGRPPFGQDQVPVKDISELETPVLDRLSDDAEEAPMYISTMVHMEGNWNDDEIEPLFLKHVDQIRLGMEIFDEYDAKLTVESEIPFSTAQINFGVNVLQELLDDGHGVGTHCDVGFREELMSVEEFAALLTERKELVDQLVGAENNRGCSGAGGVNDWALALAEAGFEYVDGLVGMHYLSMPEAERPDGWTDRYIRSEGFHENAPVDLAQSIHPFEVADATDFVPDEDGVIVVSAGSIGRLDTFAESQTDDACIRTESCALTTEDVDLEIEAIKEALELHDPTQVGKIDIYLPASIFTEENREVLEYFLAEVDKLVQEGLLEWATQAEVYDAYVAWNS